ncbi:hypothetical protein [Laspinema olomoucense]|uniref:Uncharacterized protein n=1 Tax=Laspinema olomoucense D3b TaxID=2953688 RepID=A0ABT2NH53_9CYAN|nr:hypothetical protein [Laspinema sp. D3b]MCT7981075.1 hypothetical protein [Laspinema sp. D3b]
MKRNKKSREDFTWRYQPILGSEGYVLIRFLKTINHNERSQKYLQLPLIAFWLPYAQQGTKFTEEQVKEAAWQSIYQLYNHLQNICQDFKLPLRVSLHNVNVESPNSPLEQFEEIKENSELQEASTSLAIPDDAEEFLQNFL